MWSWMRLEFRLLCSWVGVNPAPLCGIDFPGTWAVWDSKTETVKNFGINLETEGMPNSLWRHSSSLFDLPTLSVFQEFISCSLLSSGFLAVYINFWDRRRWYLLDLFWKKPFYFRPSQNYFWKPLLLQSSSAFWCTQSFLLAGTIGASVTWLEGNRDLWEYFWETWNFSVLLWPTI